MRSISKVRPCEAANGTRYRQTAHAQSSLGRLGQTECVLPLNWTPPLGIRTSADVVNTDRCHENWGIIEAAKESTARRHLAPTSDHASSLGCHLRRMSV